MTEHYHFFAYLSRMRYINRWGLMRNTFQENIQEHSHVVAVLAHALAVIRREVFGGEIDPGLAAAAALLGAWISTAVDAQVLRRPFGVYLLLSGVSLLWPGKAKKA